MLRLTCGVRQPFPAELEGLRVRSRLLPFLHEKEREVVGVVGVI